MAIIFRTALADANPTGDQEYLALSRPADLEDGDLLVAVLGLVGGAGAVATPPEGWTLVGPRVDIPGFSLVLYVKRAAAEPSYWVWQLGTPAPSSGVVVAYGNVDGYVPVDGVATAARTGASHPLPALTAAVDGCMLVAAIGLASTTTPSIGSPWRTRQTSSHTGVGGQSRVMVADREQQLAGETAAAAFTTPGAGTTGVALLALRPSQATRTEEDVVRFVHDLMPPGYEQLYDLDHPDGIGPLLDGMAAAFKYGGFDALDNLRRELNPGTATEKLVDWERILAIGADEVAAAGTIPARQAQVVARLRELGANNNRNTVRSVVGLLLGYADPQDLELFAADRAVLRSLHTQADMSGWSIPASGSVSVSFYVADDGWVSDGGVQVTALGFYFTDPAELEVTVVGPTGDYGQANVVVDAFAQLGPSAYTGESVLLRARAAAGKSVGGTWTVTFTSLGAASGSIDELYLFVEGVGRYNFPLPVEGLAGAVWEWGAVVDPALAGARGWALYAAAEKAVRRMTRAHVRGYLTYKATPGSGGGGAARYDDSNARYDQCRYGS